MVTPHKWKRKVYIENFRLRNPSQDNGPHCMKGALICGLLCNKQRHQFTAPSVYGRHRLSCSGWQLISTGFSNPGFGYIKNPFFNIDYYLSLSSSLLEEDSEESLLEFFSFRELLEDLPDFVRLRFLADDLEKEKHDNIFKRWNLYTFHIIRMDYFFKK